MKKLISIIIPTYNRGGLIINTINSVLNQTYLNWELIIVDDGSTDNTKEIIASVNDSRIKYIYRENKGPSAARNTGIKNANGEYIAFLDSDDEWLPEKIERQIKFLDKNPNIGIIGGWSTSVFENNKKLSQSCIEIKNNKTYIKALLLFPFYKINELPWTSSIIVKKECFDKVGYFDEKMISKEDWDMWLRIAIFYDFYCLDKILILRKIHNQSLMYTTDTEKIKNGAVMFLDKVYSNENLPDEFLKFKNISYSNTLFNIANFILIELNNKKIAKECLWESLKYSKNNVKRFNFLIIFFLCYSPKCAIIFYKNIKIFIKNILGKEKL